MMELDVTRVFIKNKQGWMGSGMSAIGTQSNGLGYDFQICRKWCICT
jgi:hypothetical protein